MNTNEIKTARQAAGLSQRKMAEIMGIPRRTIEDWDSGRNHPSEWVTRLVVKELNEIANGIEKERKKKMFIIYEESVEVKNRDKGKIAEGITLTYKEDHDRTEIARFETIEAARVELAKFTSDIWQLSGYLQVTERFIEEHDENDEFVEIWDYSKMEVAEDENN